MNEDLLKWSMSIYFIFMQLEFWWTNSSSRDQINKLFSYILLNFLVGISEDVPKILSIFKICNYYNISFSFLEYIVIKNSNKIATLFLVNYTRYEREIIEYFIMKVKIITNKERLAKIYWVTKESPSDCLL